MKFKLFSYEEVDSTNNIAMNLIKTKNYNNGFIVASSQKKGRGRRGRKWISKKGNLFTSIFFHLKNNYPTVEQFTLINALINFDIIKKYCGRKKISYKPPNDIYINKKKVCGILQEVVTKNKNKYLIVGIGINLITSPKLKKYFSTSIYKETNKKPKLIKLVKEIIKKYENFFKNIKNFNFSEFQNQSNKILLN